MVTPLPRRRVQKVAREFTTLDRLSDGRVVLGVGLGLPARRRVRGVRRSDGSDRERAELPRRVARGADRVVERRAGRLRRQAPARAHRAVPAATAARAARPDLGRGVVAARARRAFRRAARVRRRLRDAERPVRRASTCLPDEIRAMRAAIGRDDPDVRGPRDRVPGRRPGRRSRRPARRGGSQVCSTRDGSVRRSAQAGTRHVRTDTDVSE